MAKTKKKNNNYGGAKPAPKPAAQQQSSPMQYGLPGWLVLVCLVMLVGALLLQTKVTAGDWLAPVIYALTGLPALILGIGQKRVRDETGAKMASVLFLVFTAIAVLYLFSALTSLGALLGT